MANPKSYRLGEECERDLQRLAEHYGLKSHAEVIRMLVTKAVRTEVEKIYRAEKRKAKR